MLATLAESGLYQLLGHSSVAQYAERAFQICRSETLEMLRVAREVDRLPRLREAFESSRVSWSSLKEITRVASEETEGEWLAFAAEHTVTELRAETQDARRKKRDRPRDDRFGLPDLITRIVLELTQEERARLDAVFEQMSGELAERMGGEPLSPKDLFLYMAELFLATGGEDDRTGNERSSFAVVYHQCDDCRRARVITADGTFAVDRECVERRKGSAAEERIAVPAEVPAEAPADASAAASARVSSGVRVARHSEIDRPNSAALARRVKLRDGDRCANPGCRARERLHAHHIVFRAVGGRTVMANEVGVCDTCHALIHAGLLRVSGTPWDKLTWTPRSSGLRVDTRSSARRLSQVPHVTVESVYTDGPVSSTPGDPATGGRATGGRATGGRATGDRATGDRATGDRATGDTATSDTASQLDPEVAALLNDLAGALTRLGMSKAQAMRRLEHAHRELSRGGEAFGAAEILSRALSG